jgi:hypothetical protein
MEIRISSRWNFEWEDVQILEIESYRQELPASTKNIVDHFKSAIRLGSSLQPMLWPYFSRTDKMYEVRMYDKIDALWSLCVAVGAAVCNSNIHKNNEMTELLSNTASEVCELLHELESRAREHDPGLALNPAARKRAAETFVAEIEGKYSAMMDALTQYMAHWNFLLQVKQLDT